MRPVSKQPDRETCIMVEIENDRNCGAGGYQRHFAGSYYDLMVWYNIEGELNGFTIKTISGDDIFSISWIEGRGYFYERGISDGRSAPEQVKGLKSRKKRFDQLAEIISPPSGGIDPVVISFVAGKLRNYSEN